MYSTRFLALRGCMFLLAAAFIMQQSSEAQVGSTATKPTHKADDAYVILTYDVGDLVMNAPDYNYSSQTGPLNQPQPGMMGMGGGMGGGIMMAGGVMNRPMDSGNSGKITLAELQQTIFLLVAPDTWNLAPGVGLQEQSAPGMGRGGMGGRAGGGMAMGGGMMPGMGGGTMGGMMGGGPGMGMQPEPPKNQDDLGGEGTIVPLGNSLVIRQTAAVHAEIDELLKQLRDGSTLQKTVSIDARWLLLNSDDLDRLVTSHKDGCPLVDRQVLAEYTRRPSSIRAITNCFSGQLVYLVSGTRRNFVSGYIPVVGSLDQPAKTSRQQEQYASLSADAGTAFAGNVTLCGDASQLPAVRSSSVGYQPQIEKTNLGALLEIRPLLIPNDKRAVVDLRSTITVPGRGETSENQADILREFMVPTVDRIAIDTQELATTISMPLGQPVLAAGITYSSSFNMQKQDDKTPAKDAAPGKNSAPEPTQAAESPQLYLILELR